MSISEKRIFNTFYNQPIEELITFFNTDVYYGLKSSELNESYLKYGYNELPKIKKSIWKIYLAPIFNFLILILIITGVIIVILGSAEDTIITFTVVFLNSATVVIQQFRAQKALESLRQISALKATIIRDGNQFEVFNMLRSMRNKAAHVDDFALDKDDALEYADMANKIALILKST